MAVNTQNDVQAIITWIEESAQTQSSSVMIHPETKLLEKGLLDSLQIMDLVFHLEATHDQQIALDELTPENFDTPTSIAAMVQRATTAASQSASPS